MGQRGGHRKNAGRIRYLKRQELQTEGRLGGRGIFVTCPRGKEANAVVEARGLLEQAAEELGYDLSPSDNTEARDDGGDDDVEAQMKRELEELEGEPSAKRLKSDRRTVFANRPTKCECLAFLSVPASMDPVRLVSHIVSKARAEHSAYASRRVLRCTPVDDTCSANLGDLAILSRRILAPSLGSSRPDPHQGLRYRLDVTRRMHKEPLSRNSIITTVADVISSMAEPPAEGPASVERREASPPAYQAPPPPPAWKHKVDLDHPDLVVLVTVFKNVAGLSVVRASEYDGEAKNWNLEAVAKARDEKALASAS